MKCLSPYADKELFINEVGDDSGDTSQNNAEACNKLMLDVRGLNPVLQLRETVQRQCSIWNKQYHLAMECQSLLPPGLTTSASFLEQKRLSALDSFSVNFTDGTVKKSAVITLPTGRSGKTYKCDLNEYKAGGVGCALNCPKRYGHACCHLMKVADKGGHDIDAYHPHHKTTAHWKSSFLPEAFILPLPMTKLSCRVRPSSKTNYLCLSS